MRRAAAIGILLAALAVTRVGAASNVVPTPIGQEALYHPGVPGPGRPVACVRAGTRRYGVHLELFGRGLVVLVPAGVGIAPRCSSAALTRDPTGVIEIAAGARLTLGDFFALWGQPLGARRLVGFRTAGSERVRVWVGGRLWHGDLRAVPLRPHDEIVLELGRFVPPHVSYRFPKGL